MVDGIIRAATADRDVRGRFVARIAAVTIATPVREAAALSPYRD